jgi:hypothetical protein
MIRQYLSNNNENATVPILQKNLHLNRAQVCLTVDIFRPRLVFKNFQDFPSHRIFEHIYRILNID